METVCELLYCRGAAEVRSPGVVPDDQNFVITLSEALLQFPLVAPLAQTKTNVHIISQPIVVLHPKLFVLGCNELGCDRRGLLLVRVHEDHIAADHVGRLEKMENVQLRLVLSGQGKGIVESPVTLSGKDRTQSYSVHIDLLEVMVPSDISHTAALTGSDADVRTGISMKKLVPLPSSDSTRMDPPCSSTTFLVMTRPSPVPLGSFGRTEFIEQPTLHVLGNAFAIVGHFQDELGVPDAGSYGNVMQAVLFSGAASFQAFDTRLESALCMPAGSKRTLSMEVSKFRISVIP